MLLFGERYLLLYVYIVLQVPLHILTHTIIIPEVCCHRITNVIARYHTNNVHIDY